MLFSLIEGLEKVDIILASASPRRFELLNSIGLNFTVCKSSVKERMDCDDPIICVKENALIKGEDVAKKYPNALVISADTIVVFEKHILGKPKNEQNAFEMLKTLSANKHCVYTAFALFHRKYDQFLVDVVKTDVFFKKISDEEILSYLSTGEPFDKAGAYAIQGQGAIFIDKIEGCYTNVVGLPTSRLYSKLNEFFDQFIL